MVLSRVAHCSKHHWTFTQVVQVQGLQLAVDVCITSNLRVSSMNDDLLLPSTDGLPMPTVFHVQSAPSR